MPSCIPCPDSRRRESNSCMVLSATRLRGRSARGGLLAGGIHGNRSLESLTTWPETGTGYRPAQQFHIGGASNPRHPCKRAITCLAKAPTKRCSRQVYPLGFGSACVEVDHRLYREWSTATIASTNMAYATDPQTKPGTAMQLTNLASRTTPHYPDPRVEPACDPTSHSSLPHSTSLDRYRDFACF